MLFVWGFPGWLSLLSLPVLVLICGWHVWLRRTRAGKVYAALERVDTAANEERCKARAIDIKSVATGLRTTSRAIVCMSTLTLPWLPGVLSVYAFTPYAFMRLDDAGDRDELAEGGEGGSRGVFPALMCRQRE